MGHITLTDKTKERIALLLVRLGSDQESDVVNAARAITKALAAQGADWHDLTAAMTNGHAVRQVQPQPKPQPTTRPREDESTKLRGHVIYCMMFRDVLSDRERIFIEDMNERWESGQRYVSEKQAGWLRDIERRLRVFVEQGHGL